MSLNRRQLRNLRGIEAELAASDPGLHAFFVSFTSRAGVREVPSEMPRADRTAPWPFRLLAQAAARPDRTARAQRQRPGRRLVRREPERTVTASQVRRRAAGHHLQRVMTHKRAATIMAWWPNTMTSSSWAPGRAAARWPTRWRRRASGSCSSSAATACRARRTTGTPARSSSTTATSRRTPGTTPTASRSSPRSTTSSAARPSCTGRHCTGCEGGLRRTAAADGVSPAWPMGYDELEPYYTKAE